MNEILFEGKFSQNQVAEIISRIATSEKSVPISHFARKMKQKRMVRTYFDKQRAIARELSK